MTVTVNIGGPVASVADLAGTIRRVLKEAIVKYRVKEDVSSSNQLGPDTVFKAGVHEANEKNREALERLAELGLAERVKTADKEA